MGDYTLKHYDIDAATLLQPLKSDLGLEAVGVSLSRVEPGMGYPFFHAHKAQEEIFICLNGSGTMLVGDEEITMKPGDFLRISALHSSNLRRDASREIQGRGDVPHRRRHRDARQGSRLVIAPERLAQILMPPSR